MQKNSDEIQESLRGVKYNQHQERMIITVLTEYPNLIHELKKEKVRKIELSYDHALTAPKIVRAKENHDVAVIFINK